MVKDRGQYSNRNMVKQMAKYSQKISGDEARRRGGVMSLVPGVKNSRLRNGLEFDRGVVGLLRQITYEVIPADHEHLESLV